MKPDKILRCVAAVLGAFWGLGVAVFVIVLFILRADAGLSPSKLPFGVFLGWIAACFLCGVYGALHLLYRIYSGRLAKLGTVGLASVFVIVPLLLVGAFSCRINPYIPPSDATLLAQFDKHEAAFNTLVHMAQADKGQRNSLSDARGAQYQRWLAQGEIPHGLTDDDPKTDSQDDGIRLNQWCIPYKATFFHDEDDEIYTHYTKGFIYLTHRPREILSSLDTLTYEARTYPYKTAYRPIRGNWYLFYEYDSQP